MIPLDVRYNHCKPAFWKIKGDVKIKFTKYGSELNQAAQPVSFCENMPKIEAPYPILLIAF